MDPIAFGSRMTGRQDDAISSGSVLDDEYCNTETVILNDSEGSSQFLLSQYRT